MDEDEVRKQAQILIDRMNSDEVQALVNERGKLMLAEYEVREEAPWFGTTGLPDDLERELPRYLRREFAESLFEEDSLKAADLVYLGRYPTIRGSVDYFWSIPSSGEEIFAQISISDDGSSSTGWGVEGPPE